jgi:hypothetical protein
MTKQQAYKLGLEHGYEHARYCDLSEADYQQAEQNDTLGELLGDIIENFRQYTPFEFYAAEMNSARNPDGQWSEYDRGEYEGWTKGLEQRFGKATATNQ